MSAQTVFIATPSIDGKVGVHYAAALVDSTEQLRAGGIGYRLSFELGSSIISAARNTLVARFMRSDADDLVFIDADISWSGADLVKLIGHDADVVGGVYQRKSRDKLDFTVKFGDSILGAGALIGVERVGTGFLRIRRRCIERMMAAHPELRLIDRTDPDNDRYYALFENSIVDGVFVGEDFTFCDRWRALGGAIMIDPSIRLAHWGTVAFDAALEDHLVQNPGASGA